MLQLAPLVVQALAHALDYVRPLHMEAVLRYGASFKPFHDAHQMLLSPNALRFAACTSTNPVQSAPPFACCVRSSVVRAVRKSFAWLRVKLPATSVRRCRAKPPDTWHLPSTW